MQPLIIALTVMVGVWCAAMLPWWLMQRRRRDILVRLEAMHNPVESSSTASASSPQAQLTARIDPDGVLKAVLWRSGLTMSGLQFLLLCLILGLGFGAPTGLLTENMFFGVMAALMGALAPFAMLTLLEAKRKALFEEQLPDALSMIGSGLRSGASFLQSLQLVAEEMPAPMQVEIKRLLEETYVGVTLEDALIRLTKRVRSYEVELLATSIAIHNEVGGNLAQLMDTIEQTLRDRSRLRQEVSGLTAEGRLSGGILFALPPIMFAVMMVMNPDYMKPFFSHPLGFKMMAAAFVLQFVGGIIILRMLKIDT